MTFINYSNKYESLYANVTASIVCEKSKYKM